MDKKMTSTPSLARFITGILGALPELGMALYFLAVWISPQSFGDEALHFALMVIFVEFISIHSAGITLGVLTGESKSRSHQVLALSGLSLFYLLFIVVFSYAFQSWWPLLIFAGLVLNRILAVLTGQLENREKRDVLVMSWVAPLVFFVIAAFVTAIIPLPALGIEGRLPSLPGGGTSSGVWVEEPYRLMAMAVFYYLTVGAFEVWMAYESWRGSERGENTSS